MPKAIFTSYQPYALMYARDLVEKHGWEPQYFYTVPAVEAEFRKTFPRAIMHDYYDSIKGIPPAEFKDMVTDPIDPEWLSEFGMHESIAMNMMERNDPSQTFTYKERLSLYHDYIRYWTTVLRKLQPDFIVLEEEPLESSDYVLTIVAKKLGIRTIMFLRLPFFRMFLVTDFREGSPAIRRAYEKALNAHAAGAPVQLGKPIREYLDKIRSSYDIHKHLYNQSEGLNKLIRKEGLAGKLSRKTFRLLKLFNLFKLPKRIRAVMAQGEPSVHQDKKSVHGPFRTTSITNREDHANIQKAIRRNEQLKEYYDKITKQPIDTSVPFIIYALNFQPERTTSPIGDHFVNQFLAIGMLAKSLPEGWKLYVKEHPSQFIHFMWGSTYRSEEYYDAIAKLPNVQLIPLIYDNYTLIDQSKAVATITGTMAWEAIVRERPAIIFGHSWYKFCEGIFYTPALSDVKAAIGKIAAGYKPDFTKIQLFARVLEENSYPAFVGGNQEYIYSGITHEENAAAHLSAILAYTSSEQ